MEQQLLVELSDGVGSSLLCSPENALSLTSDRWPCIWIPENEQSKRQMQKEQAMNLDFYRFHSKC